MTNLYQTIVLKCHQTVDLLAVCEVRVAVLATTLPRHSSWRPAAFTSLVLWYGSLARPLHLGLRVVDGLTSRLYLRPDAVNWLISSRLRRRYHLASYLLSLDMVHLYLLAACLLYGYVVCLSVLPRGRPETAAYQPNRNDEEHLLSG